LPVFHIKLYVIGYITPINIQIENIERQYLQQYSPFFIFFELNTHCEHVLFMNNYMAKEQHMINMKNRLFVSILLVMGMGARVHASDTEGQIRFDGAIYSAQIGHIFVTQNEHFDCICVKDNNKNICFYQAVRGNSCTKTTDNGRFLYLDETDGHYLIPYITLFLTKKREYLAALQKSSAEKKQ
jgi:hypothetical protein